MPWPPILKPLHLRVNPVARRLAVLSAGGCMMVLRGERLRLTEARLMPLDDLPPVFPRWFETGLRHLVRTEDCLLLRVGTDG